MKNIKMLWNVAFLFALFGCALVLPRTAVQNDVTSADDAYHYGEFNDGQHDETYIEWWYFNFSDEENGIQGLFTYGIIDPDNISEFGVANVIAVIYTPDGILQESDNYSVSDFFALSDRVYVSINSNSVEALDEDTYRIAGSSRSGKVSWDVTYERNEKPWFAFDKAPVGFILPWMNMSWLLYMPGAGVNGTVILNASDGTSRSYDIRGAKGYHDHNWGEWIPAGPMWSWAQYYEPGWPDKNKLILDVGDIYNRDVGEIRVEYDGDATIFEKSQYLISRSRWQYDSEHQQFYPERLTIFAHNTDENKLLFVTIESSKTAPIYKEAPKPSPNIIIYEQTAHFSGALYEKGRHGWSRLVSFDGDGFAEYTLRDWVK